VTDYMVNTSSNTVHRPDCSVVLRARTDKWLAPWQGVGRAEHDKACGYCLPDGLPNPDVEPERQTWVIEWKRADHRTHVAWNRYGTETGEDATKATLALMRVQRPAADGWQWRATRTVVEDW
jgi:hypothetical protein